jgi:hypothetical protein
MPKVIDTYEIAKEIRETFHKSPVKKNFKLPFEWPNRILHIGKGAAEIYHSDKWKTVDDYKHVAEAPQRVYLCPGTSILDDKGKAHKFAGKWKNLPGRMPQHLAILANSLGFMIELHDGRCFQVDIPHARWAASRFPDCGAAFLALYSDEGLHFIVTGDELDVTEDGIVG